MKIDAESNSPAQSNPTPAARDAAREAADRAMTGLIAEAIDAKRSWGAQRWFRALSAELEELGHEPMSMSRYMRLFAAERARRKAERIQAGRRAGSEVGAAVGDGPLVLGPGLPPVSRADFERVVASVIAMRSQSIGDARMDIGHAAYLRGERGVAREAFEAILYAPVVIDTVPHARMPDWWRRKVARLRAASAPR